MKLLRVINDIYQIKTQGYFGLLQNKGQRKKLIKDYLRLAISDSSFISKKNNYQKLLNFYIRSYDLFDILRLFRSIFIIQEYFFESSTPKPLIIDCGSHVGMSILYFKVLYPNSKILGFEPAPETYSFLKENIDRNDLKDVILINKVLSNREGERVRFYGDTSQDSSLYKENWDEPVNETELETTKLSKYIDRDVDFLKLDIEGAERLVFKDLATENKFSMIKQLVFEYHHHLMPDEDEFSKYLKILEDNNFGYIIHDTTGVTTRIKAYEKECLIIYAYQK
jgi:FkbM family methyltransferase